MRFIRKDVNYRITPHYHYRLYENLLLHHDTYIGRLPLPTL